MTDITPETRKLAVRNILTLAIGQDEETVIDLLRVALNILEKSHG